jgi:hypothetical protein
MNSNIYKSNQLLKVNQLFSKTTKTNNQPSTFGNFLNQNNESTAFNVNSQQIKTNLQSNENFQKAKSIFTSPSNHSTPILPMANNPGAGRIFQNKPKQERPQAASKIFTSTTNSSSTQIDPYNIFGKRNWTSDQFDENEYDIDMCSGDGMSSKDNEVSNKDKQIPHISTRIDKANLSLPQFEEMIKNKYEIIDIM